MGGVAGHLNHIHENLDFTFGEIKSVLSDVASANIEAVDALLVNGCAFGFDIVMLPVIFNVSVLFVQVKAPLVPPR